MALPTLAASSGRNFWDVLGRFDKLSRVPFPAWALVVLIWALFVFPGIGIRSFHYEEGYIVAVARGAIEDGYWLTPHLYGWRFVERPNLMAWTVALIAAPFGGPNQWITRTPAVLSLLGSALLLFWLVRRYASALAAVFAAACFIASPMMLQKAVTAEPDVMVAFILFAAFVVWWLGVEQDRLRFPRWLALGALLALAALVKGPQPLGYFGLAAGAFHLWRGEWRNLVGLAFSGLIAGLVTLAWYAWVYQPGDLHFWLYASKIGLQPAARSQLLDSAILLVTLLLEAMPAILVAAPFAFIMLRSPRSKETDLVTALVLYAGLASLALIVWPGARGRYAMPGLLAVAAIAGLAFDRFRGERPQLLNGALILAAMLAAYQVALSWLVMPAVPEAFQRTRNAAFAMSSLIAAQPAMLYVPSDTLNKNIVAYVREPMRVVPLSELETVAPPAWILTTPEFAGRLRALRPDLAMTTRAKLDFNGVFHLIELRGLDAGRAARVHG